MANITAALVKELREKTSAGMMDCKKALMATDGNIEDAADWLREKGIAKAGKKSGRVASEGLIGLGQDGTTSALVEVNSETDFVALNEEFQGMVREIASLAVGTNGDLAALAGTNMASGKDVATSITDLIAKIGENMNLRRTEVLSVKSGAVAGYLHNGVADNLGKIGVLIALESDGDTDALTALGRKLAMHVAATSPLSLSVEDMDPAAVQKERDLLSAEARASGKPENIIDKMVDGRMQKFFKESVLLNQMFVMDPDRSIAQVIADEAKSMGAAIEMTGFVRMQLGEGIEKKVEDFAAEVAATLGDA
ncbi:MAG: translation elongation factor Ts [Robiginitomaculum sp.]|nr:translation elongation factor Ts [Robiginitomaculum sp.]